MMRHLSILLVLLLICTMIPATAEEDSPLPLEGRIYILHTNDVHGHAVAGNSTWGYQAIARVRSDLTAKGADVLLLDAGDFSQGTPLVNLDRGASAIAFMNAAGYSAGIPGNHEFDWGIDNLLQNAESLNYPMLCANMLYKETGDPVFAPNAVFETSTHMIGVFGLATPETMTKANPTLIRGITFLDGEDLYACAQAQVDELTASGCDFIICIGHLGDEDESIGNRSIDVINNIEGIDLFIDGHCHEEVCSDIEAAGENETTRLVQTGSCFNNIGVEVIDADGKITSYLYKAPAVLDALTSEYVPVDETVADIVNARSDEVNAALSDPFAVSEVLLNGERNPGVRTEETNLGDFSCDAILWTARQAYSPDVDAAITVGGDIRASIQIGEVSMLDMKTVFPFGNTIYVLTVTGAELLEAIEAATFSTPDAIGAFPQVSGIVYTVDTSVPYEPGDRYPDSTYYAPANPGSRVTIESVNGKSFALEDTYLITTNNFTACGGDTYYVFRYATATSGYDTNIAPEDALVNYTTEVLGGVIGEQYAEPAGRITVK